MRRRASQGEARKPRRCANTRSLWQKTKMGTVPLDASKVGRCRALASENRRRRPTLHRQAHDRRRRAGHPARLRRRRNHQGVSPREHRRRALRKAGLLGRGIGLLPRARASRGARTRKTQPSASPSHRRSIGARPVRRRRCRERGPCPRHRRERSPASTRLATSARRRKARLAAGRNPAEVRHRRDRQHLRRRRAGQGGRARRGRHRRGHPRDGAVAPRLRAARRDDRGLRRHVRHAGELQDHPARRSTRRASEYGRYIQQTNYSSGLCMAEIAWMACGRAPRHAPERRDVRHSFPRHQHVPHASSTSTSRAGSSRGRASSSTPARTTT